MKHSEILKAALATVERSRDDDGETYLCHAVLRVDLGQGVDKNRKGIGFGDERIAIKDRILKSINGNFTYNSYLMNTRGMEAYEAMSYEEVQASRIAHAEKLISAMELEESVVRTVSALLLKAKARLSTGEAGSNGWTFICHAIAEAAGVDYRGDMEGYPEVARRATKAVEAIVGIGNQWKGDTPTFRKFHRELHDGDDYQPASVMQPGRHRLLDYLIAEFQAQGN